MDDLLSQFILFYFLCFGRNEVENYIQVTILAYVYSGLCLAPLPYSFLMSNCLFLIYGSLHYHNPNS